MHACYPAISGCWMCLCSTDSATSVTGEKGANQQEAKLSTQQRGSGPEVSGVTCQAKKITACHRVTKAALVSGHCSVQTHCQHAAKELLNKSVLHSWTLWESARRPTHITTDMFLSRHLIVRVGPNPWMLQLLLWNTLIIGLLLQVGQQQRERGRVWVMWVMWNLTKNAAQQTIITHKTLQNHAWHRQMERNIQRWKQKLFKFIAKPMRQSVKRFNTKRPSVGSRPTKSFPPLIYRLSQPTQTQRFILKKATKLAQHAPLWHTQRSWLLLHFNTFSPVVLTL